MMIEVTPKGDVLCAWFVMCSNVTTTALDHPVLGPVPCCKRCATISEQADDLMPFTITPERTTP